MKSKNKKEISKWLALSSLGIQMGVLIYLGAYFGKKIDIYYGFERNWSAVGLSFLGLLIGFYWLLRTLKDTNK